MVEAESIAALASGAVLGVVGAGGTVVVLAGVLLGIFELGLAAVAFPVLLAVGAGLAAYGAVDLAGDLLGGDGRRWLDDLDVHALRKLVD